MSTVATGTTTAIPTPRTTTEQAPRRRQRPASQYWDVFECCWRTRADAPPAL